MKPAIENHQVLEVDKETLSKLGLTRTEVWHSCGDAELNEVLAELKTEDCVHTWQDIDIPKGTASHQLLWHFENHKRPTELFYYFGYDLEDTPHLLGVAAVAEKISNKFDVSGFPVIARCFIRKQFRNARLYFPLLKHRFNYCLKLFGENLKGIHLGSQNPRVFEAIKKGMLGLDFIYLGDEWLSQGSDHERVQDYIWLSNKMRMAMSSNPIPNIPQGYNLKNQVKKLLCNDFEANDFARLKKNIKDLESASNWNLSQSESLRDLISFCEAIPVIESEEKAENESKPVTVKRSAS